MTGGIINVPAPTKIVDPYNIQGFGRGFTNSIMDSLAKAEEKKKVEALVQMVQLLQQQATGQAGASPGGGLPGGAASAPVGGARPFGNATEFVNRLLQAAPDMQTVQQGMQIGNAMGVFKEAEKVAMVDPSTGRTARVPFDQVARYEELGWLAHDEKTPLVSIWNQQTGERKTLPQPMADSKTIGKDSPWQTLPQAEGTEPMTDAERLAAEHKNKLDEIRARADAERRNRAPTEVDLKVSSYNAYKKQAVAAGMKPLPYPAWAEHIKQQFSDSGASPNDKMSGLKLAAITRYLAGRATPQEIRAFNIEPDALDQAAKFVNDDPNMMDLSADDKVRETLRLAENLQQARKGSGGGGVAGTSWRQWLYDAPGTSPAPNDGYFRPKY